MRSVVLVMRNFTFNCAGTISQWSLSWSMKYRYSRPSSTKVHFFFYVLRPDPRNRSRISTVGKNNKMLNIESNSSLSSILSQNRDIDIPTDERITVQDGDFVALVVQVLGSCDRKNYIFLNGQSRNE